MASIRVASKKSELFEGRRDELKSAFGPQNSHGMRLESYSQRAFSLRHPALGDFFQYPRVCQVYPIEVPHANDRGAEIRR